MAERSYKYLSSTMSFCEKCEKLVPAKIIEEKGQVFLLKYCPIHGITKELYEEDAAYHNRKNTYNKNSTLTNTETDIKLGCPYDCGLCPMHDQHTCIAVIEITNKCDLGCPVCYANSGIGKDLDLETITKMISQYQKSEDNKAEILQISGGEPTMHPDIIKIIEIAKDANIPFVMINTNGIRIAEDEDFVRKLSKFNEKGFEIYLQFDGMDDQIYQKIRGRSLFDKKKQAISNLIKYKIPVTLVATVIKGINDDQIGSILSFAMEHDFIRGVNLQPIGYFGRYDNSIKRDPITLSGILSRIEKQTNKLIQINDFVPLPCNVDRVAITYLLKQNGVYASVLRNKNIERSLSNISNTFLFTADNMIKIAKESVKISDLFGGGSCCSCMDILRDISNMIPKGFLNRSQKEKKEYLDTQTFRISVSSFVDMRNFDMRSMQKECVHIITPDLKRIPFSAYNMIHRKKYQEM